MDLPFVSQVKAWADQLPGLQNMFRGPVTSIGLDVGSSMIKGVKVIRKEGRLTLLQQEVAAVPIGDKSSVARAILQKLLQKLDPRDTFVVTAIGGSGVVLRSILMPKMSLSELRGAFNYEAEKYIPFKPDEAFLDFVVLGDRPGGPTRHEKEGGRRQQSPSHRDTSASATPTAPHLPMC